MRAEQFTRRRACRRRSWERLGMLVARTVDIWSPLWKCRRRCDRTAWLCNRGRSRGWAESFSPTLWLRARGNSTHTTASRRSKRGSCCVARRCSPLTETESVRLLIFIWAKIFLTFDLKLSRIPCCESSNELILTRWSWSSKPGIKTVMLRGPLNPKMFVSCGSKEVKLDVQCEQGSNSHKWRLRDPIAESQCCSSLRGRTWRTWCRKRSILIFPRIHRSADSDRWDQRSPRSWMFYSFSSFDLEFKNRLTNWWENLAPTHQPTRKLSCQCRAQGADSRSDRALGPCPCGPALSDTCTRRLACLREIIHWCKSHREKSSTYQDSSPTAQCFQSHRLPPHYRCANWLWWLCWHYSPIPVDYRLEKTLTFGRSERVRAECRSASSLHPRCRYANWATDCVEFVYLRVATRDKEFMAHMREIATSR